MPDIPAAVIYRHEWTSSPDNEWAANTSDASQEESAAIHYSVPYQRNRAIRRGRDQPRSRRSQSEQH